MKIDGTQASSTQRRGGEIKVRSMGLSGLNFPVPSTNSSQSSLGCEQSWGSTLKGLSSDIVHSFVAILICYKNYHSRRPLLSPEQLLS